MERQDPQDDDQARACRHARRLRRSAGERPQAQTRGPGHHRRSAKAEIAEKQARSIKYQLTTACLPLAKELADFTFAGMPINEALLRELAGGGFLDLQCNLVLIGGTGTCKTHLAAAIARARIRAGRRGRFFNVVDLVSRLEAETRAGRQGRIADQLVGRDFVILDELGYLPFAQSGG